MVMTYPFLVLCLLLLVPGIGIFLLRRDMRRPMLIVAAAALPFAFTEFLFYPTYWEPRFLFDLADRIGFGIEDFLFVAGLGAYTAAIYPAVFRQHLTPGQPSGRSVASRFVWPLIAALILTAILALARVPMIWGCVPIMLAVAAVIVWQRRDLFTASIWGGMLSAASYYIICVGLGMILPGVFEMNWNAEQFSNIYLTGVPLEEIMYAFGAGTVATVFYPFVFSYIYVGKTERDIKPNDFSK